MSAPAPPRVRCHAAREVRIAQSPAIAPAPAPGSTRTTPEAKPARCLAATFAVVIVICAIFDTLSFPMVSTFFLLLLGCSGAYVGISRSEAVARARAGTGAS